MPDRTPIPKPTDEPPRWQQLLLELRWPLVAVALAVVAFLAYRETLLRVDRAAGTAGDLAQAAAEQVGEIAERFMTGDVTETFVSAIPEISGAGSGRLELASAEVTETLTRSDERRVLWDMLSLGTAVSEIRVPVVYRYHLRLDDPWYLEVSGDTCIVKAPPIRATQPPAIRTDQMSKRQEADWLRLDAAQQLAELERSITPRLIAYARDERHLGLVRDEARRTVEAFVRGWLLQEGQWGDERVRFVKVIFEGETPPAAAEPPDLRIRADG